MGEQALQTAFELHMHAKIEAVAEGSWPNASNSPLCVSG